MAERREIKQGDTEPPLKGTASDRNGLMPLSIAQELRVLIRRGDTLVQGVAAALDPPEVDPDDPDGLGLNWAYEFAEGDTDNPIGEYDVELKITWAPGRVTRVKNRGGVKLVITPNLGG